MFLTRRVLLTTSNTSEGTTASISERQFVLPIFNEVIGISHLLIASGCHSIFGEHQDKYWKLRSKLNQLNPENPLVQAALLAFDVALDVIPENGFPRKVLRFKMLPQLSTDQLISLEVLAQAAEERETTRWKTAARLLGSLGAEKKRREESAYEGLFLFVGNREFGYPPKSGTNVGSRHHHPEVEGSESPLHRPCKYWHLLRGCSRGDTCQFCHLCGPLAANNRIMKRATKMITAKKILPQKRLPHPAGPVVRSALNTM